MNIGSERAPKRAAVSTVVKSLVAVALVAAALLVWLFFKQPSSPPSAEQVLPVETVRPAVGTLDRTVMLDSHVASDSVVTVLPKVAGTLISLPVDVGSLLRSGDMIAQIDPSPYQIAVNQAKAIYDGATSTYERQRQLYATSATSRQSYDQARTQYENAKSQYDLAQLNLGYTRITSPVEGTVIQRHASEGTLVSPSVPIVTISNTRALVIRTDVPESYARAFDAGREALGIIAQIPAMGSSDYRLRIRTIAPAINVRTKTFSVECEIEGDTTGILPGMFAQVTFVLERHAGVAYLPFSALVGSTTLWYVDSGGRAQYLSFTPGYHNDAYFELPAQYRDYTFILAGQHFLSAGSAVKAIGVDQAAQ